MKREKSLIRRLYSFQAIQKLNQKDLYLGSQKKLSLSSFLWLRLLVCVCFFFVFFFFVPYGLFFGPFLAILIYYGMEYLFFDRVIFIREKKLEREAIFFFEVLLLALEGGRSLSSALYITSSHVEGELSLEVQKCFQEMDLGKSFSEAMMSLRSRISSRVIHEVFLNIEESSVFGNDVSKAMEQQLLFLREKRLLDIKGEITKLPTKISVISVLFFLPLLFLLILAPLLLRFLK